MPYLSEDDLPPDSFTPLDTSYGDALVTNKKVTRSTSRAQQQQSNNTTQEEDSSPTVDSNPGAETDNVL